MPVPYETELVGARPATEFAVMPVMPSAVVGRVRGVAPPVVNCVPEIWTFQPAPEPVASLTVDLPSDPVATWSAPVSVALKLADPGDVSVNAPPLMPVLVVITPARDVPTLASTSAAVATAASAAFLKLIPMPVAPLSPGYLVVETVRRWYQDLYRGS